MYHFHVYVNVATSSVDMCRCVKARVNLNTCECVFLSKNRTVRERPVVSSEIELNCQPADAQAPDRASWRIEQAPTRRVLPEDVGEHPCTLPVEWEKVLLFDSVLWGSTVAVLLGCTRVVVGDRPKSIMLSECLGRRTRNTLSNFTLKFWCSSARTPSLPFGRSESCWTAGNEVYQHLIPERMGLRSRRMPSLQPTRIWERRQPLLKSMQLVWDIVVTVLCWEAMNIRWPGDTTPRGDGTFVLVGRQWRAASLDATPARWWYRSAENNYRCKSLINSKTISVSKKIKKYFCRTY